MNNAKLVAVAAFILLMPLVSLPAVRSQPANAQSVVVTVLVTSRPANTFIPKQALGAGVDGLHQGDVAEVYTPPNLAAMRSAGLGTLTYRLRTELGVEAWHWNPQGVWSKPGRSEGYWTSRTDTKKPLSVCYGYRLPRRGSTIDQANNDGYSRLDDGNARTFWKSNPYLDRHFTGEDNAQHPQWALIDLGRTRPVNAIQIAWAAPYAVRYQVQYWDGGSGGADTQSIDDTFGDGAWRTFPSGSVTQGRGGLVRLRLCPSPKRVRFVRIWMTQSSGGRSGTGDVRDGLGYAISETGLGTLDAGGRFHDFIRHAASGKRQTPITVSSTDPWHRVADKDLNVEQPGFDRVFHSGLTRGLPLLTPTGLLYDTPDNAAAELRFLRARGYPVTQMELGEEPDGQYAAPEDYGALYIQWAEALHRVDPTIKLGGPSFQTAIYGWLAWPDAHGNRFWLNRFLRYLKRRGKLADFAFFSLEWYPFDNVCGPPAPQLALEPRLLENALARLQREGLPRRIPWLITEYGYSAFAGQAEMDWPGALLNAEVAAQFLTLGGSAAYLYGYEPGFPTHEVSDCDTWGDLALLLSNDSHEIRKPLATYWAARLLTQQWAQPGGQSHAVYRASSNLQNRLGLPLVTAYAVHRPDGQWAVLLINKDPKQPHSITVRFSRPADKPLVAFTGPVDLFQYSKAQYVWHPRKAHGYPSPDLPPMHRVITVSTVTLPPYSLSILRGHVAGLP